MATQNFKNLHKLADVHETAMFSISLTSFIVAKSRDRRRENTFRPWNTEVFGLDARERETG